MLRRVSDTLKSWGRNAAALLMALVVLFALLEAGLRLTFRSNDAQTLVYVRRADAINGFAGNGLSRRKPAQEIRLLMLGASAFVTRDFQPQFERLLNESPRLRALGKNVRVVSTGVPAHMTFDSLWKYRYWYDGYDFDLVVVYHGINDARANCYPDSMFRDDYTMMPYFRQYAGVFDWMGRHPVLSRSFVATWIYKLVTQAAVRAAPHFQREHPYNDPRNDAWLPEGEHVKTGPTFERNLEAIVSLARQRKQPVLLLTYAWYLPDDYTNERFMNRELDYSFTDESVAVEVWGYSYNVVRALNVHNDAVRRVASRHPEARFLDMRVAIPADGQHFIDVCHWTDRGRAAFARGVEDVLLEIDSTPSTAAGVPR